ncbi:porin [Methylobacterium sp. J-077]|uniref:porin n=1 Tax=Methylobacterium sp. J-077 TaxID=2836656 RepID=UPI001FB949E7|nr:porin [Methylobacterium sp. J-077]MCJ2123730.1 porin [Methylobacterium sp. J-077]
MTAALGLGPAEARDFERASITPSVIPCPSKGPGFVRLPGSASCIRVSGRVTAGADLRTGHGIDASGVPAITGRLAIDNRADTDLGEVRTFVRIGNGRR